MGMELSIWEIAIVIAHSVIYFSTAACIAGVYLSRLLDNRLFSIQVSLDAYVYLGCIIGVFASICAFFSAVGLAADNGFPGIFDAQVALMLWQTSLGTSLVVKVVSFLLVLVTTKLVSRESFVNINLLFIIQFLGVLGLVSSYGIVGHISDLGVIAKSILMIHIVLVSCWIGSLWPLLSACKILDSHELQKLMHRFGSYALYAVGILILFGGLLSILLVNDWSQLLYTEYGIVFALKLLLVLIVLAVAALNKLLFVPRLIENNNGNGTLQISIRVELGFAILVFMVTAVLSATMGPSH